MAEPLQLPIEQLRFNADGLIPAIAQDWLDGAVLMVAWMNRQALELTLSTREVHYWSRSRQELWHKGATSGHFQDLRPSATTAMPMSCCSPLSSAVMWPVIPAPAAAFTKTDLPRRLAGPKLFLLQLMPAPNWPG